MCFFIRLDTIRLPVQFVWRYFDGDLLLYGGGFRSCTFLQLLYKRREEEFDFSHGREIDQAPSQGLVSSDLEVNGGGDGI